MVNECGATMQGMGVSAVKPHPANCINVCEPMTTNAV